MHEIRLGVLFQNFQNDRVSLLLYGFIDITENTRSTQLRIQVTYGIGRRKILERLKAAELQLEFYRGYAVVCRTISDSVINL